MKAFKIYSKENKEVIVTYSKDLLYKSFLYSGFTSVEEAKLAVINSNIDKQAPSNDIEAYQAQLKEEEFVNSGTWTEILS